MLKGLLDRMVPERRPLAVLVGVLALVFALTAALAVNAHRADVARNRQAAAALQDLVSGAAADWAMYIQQFTFSSIETAYRPALRELGRHPDTPLAELAALAHPESFCGLCPAPGDQTVHWSIDPRTGATEQIPRGALPDAVLKRIAGLASAGTQPLLRESIAGVVFLEQVGTEAVVAAVFTRLGHDGEPLRIVGFTLPAESLAPGLASVFSAMRLLPPSPAQGLSNERVFSIALRAGGATLLPAQPDATAPAAVHRLTETIIGNAEVEVALREGAAGLLLLDGGRSGLPLLAGLMIAITVLLLMALLLVRREAELVRLRADFVSGVSHELRTPLAQIRMFTETLLLGRTRSDMERRRSLEIIDQEARRLARLVENVLLFSKSQGGRVTPIAPEPTRVAAEIQAAVESFGPLCRSRSVEVRVEAEAALTAPVDRGALRQILVNLMENALKYGPTGQRITVGAALYGETARIWVDDEGPGIPPAERERVFESFYRIAPQEGEVRRSGSGIGLSVVRELARLHGGVARAEAAPGGGARLLVELPGAHPQVASGADLAAAS